MPAAGGATDNRYAQHRTGRPASAAYRSSGADHQAWVAQGTARSGGTDHRLRLDRNRSLPPGRDPRASTSATSIGRVSPPYSRRSISSPSFRTGSRPFQTGTYLLVEGAIHRDPVLDRNPSANLSRPL